MALNPSLADSLGALALIMSSSFSNDIESVFESEYISEGTIRRLQYVFPSEKRPMIWNIEPEIWTIFCFLCLNLHLLPLYLFLLKLQNAFVAKFHGYSGIRLCVSNFINLELFGSKYPEFLFTSTVNGFLYRKKFILCTCITPDVEVKDL